MFFVKPYNQDPQAFLNSLINQAFQRYYVHTNVCSTRSILYSGFSPANLTIDIGSKNSDRWLILVVWLHEFSHFVYECYNRTDSITYIRNGYNIEKEVWRITCRIAYSIGVIVPLAVIKRSLSSYRRTKKAA